LPYAAVFQADLASLMRSWVLRAWFVLTVLVALAVLFQRGEPDTAQERPVGAVLAALLHPIDATPSAAQTLRELLKIYIVIWVSFIIVLTGGTISAELGVVADAVLSRGISRWQYFMGKWTARMTAVLGVYTLVVVPTALVLWLDAAPAELTEAAVTQAQFEGGETPAAALMPNRTVTFGGAAFALGHVAVILAFVVTCGVALSAGFDSTVISIAVGWVSIYGTGLILSILDVPNFSPGRLIRELPDLIGGHFAVIDQCWKLGGWACLSLVVILATGSLFSTRDV
jgi:hypothetical protein